MTVTARKDLQSARRLALLGPVVDRTARAQGLAHSLLHVADTLPARAKAPRSESIGVVRAMAQGVDRDQDQIGVDPG